MHPIKTFLMYLIFHFQVHLYFGTLWTACKCRAELEWVYGALYLVQMSRRGLSFALYPSIFHIPRRDKSGSLTWPEKSSIYRPKSCNALQCLYPEHERLHTLMAVIASCYCQTALPMLLLGQEGDASGHSQSLQDLLCTFLLPLVNPCVMNLVLRLCV